MFHYFLRVIPKGDEFFSNLESTFLSSASNIDIISAWFLLIFEYVVAETICYLNVSSFFQSDVRIMLTIMIMIINIIMIIMVWWWSWSTSSWSPLLSWSSSCSSSSSLFTCLYNFSLSLYSKYSNVLNIYWVLNTDHLNRPHDELNF